MAWNEIETAVDKVHTHICKHFTYDDLRTLLSRSGIWDDPTVKYLSNIIAE